MTSPLVFATRLFVRFLRLNGRSLDGLIASQSEYSLALTQCCVAPGLTQCPTSDTDRRPCVMVRYACHVRACEVPGLQRRQESLRETGGGTRHRTPEACHFRGGGVQLRGGQIIHNVFEKEKSTGLSPNRPKLRPLNSEGPLCYGRESELDEIAARQSESCPLVTSQVDVDTRETDV